MTFRATYGQAVRAALLPWLVLFCSCSKGEPEVQHPRCALLVWMGGDNNLSTESDAKVEAIRSGIGSTAGDCLVYQDTEDRGARLLAIRPGTPAVIETLIEYGRENSASAGVFAQRLGEMIARCQAEHYGLLFFSHASGWLPEGGLSDPARPVSAACTASGLSRSVGKDGTSEMDLRSFAAAIPTGTFDYIVFEACFMAGVEVAWELRGKAEYVLASSAEIVSPGFTPIYPGNLHRLLDGAAREFGQAAYDRVLTYSENRRSATLSLIWTPALDALADFIARNCPQQKDVALQEVQHFDRLGNHRIFFDLEDYYSRLLDSDALRAELARRVAACVPWKVSTPTFLPQNDGFQIACHSGLTTYVPQDRFPALNVAHDALGWNRRIARASP